MLTKKKVLFVRLLFGKFVQFDHYSKQILKFENIAHNIDEQSRRDIFPSSLYYVVWLNRKIEDNNL